MNDITDREMATVLAALRHWQTCQASCPNWGDGWEIFDGTTPLTPAEIDQLCEQLNCGPESDFPSGDKDDDLAHLIGLQGDLYDAMREYENVHGDDDELATNIQSSC